MFEFYSDVCLTLNVFCFFYYIIRVWNVYVLFENLIQGGGAYEYDLEVNLVYISVVCRHKLCIGDTMYIICIVVYLHCLFLYFLIRNRCCFKGINAVIIIIICKINHQTHIKQFLCML